MTTSSATADLRYVYLRNVLASQRKTALELMMQAVMAGHPVIDLYTAVLQEALYEVGRLWETGYITVADEHLATAITQFVMANLYQHLEVSATRRGTVVVTGVEGEFHQVGANMVSDLLEADGWEVIFLGCNVPAAHVVETVRHHRPQILGISATLQGNVPAVVQLAGMVRWELGEKAPAILLGGGAFKRDSALPEELRGCLVAGNLYETLEITRSFGR